MRLETPIQNVVFVSPKNTHQIPSDSPSYDGREAKLNVAECTQLRNKVFDLVAAGHSRIVVDFSGISAIEIAALGALLSIARFGSAEHTRLRKERTQVVLSNVSFGISRILHLTRIDNTFRTFKTNHEAARFLSEGVDLSIKAGPSSQRTQAVQ